MSIELYHGSPVYFDYPDVTRGKSYRDFGVGFYLAENEIDSLSIAIKDTYSGYLYTYDLDEDVFNHYTYIEFDGFTEDWFKFVYDCRMGNQEQNYDIIIGPTAGGTVNDIFEDARKRELSFEEIYPQMKREIINTRFGIQWCITNQDALKYLERTDYEEITR